MGVTVSVLLSLSLSELELSETPWLWLGRFDEDFGLLSSDSSSLELIYSECMSVWSVVRTPVV